MVSTLPIFGVFVLRSTGIHRNAQENLSPALYGVVRGYCRHGRHGVPLAFRCHAWLLIRMKNCIFCGPIT